MLLAVEGGGFFSSSASGYSKGLMLLLLGRSKDERPMRIAPWSQYQLAEQEGNLNHQLAPRNTGDSCGCASFICFQCASAGVEGPLPPKVGPVNHSEISPCSSSPGCDQDKEFGSKCVPDKNVSQICLKSSLKKPSAISSTVAIERDQAQGFAEGGNHEVSCTVRKVHWTDSCGRELVQIKQFEPRYEF